MPIARSMSIRCVWFDMSTTIPLSPDLSALTALEQALEEFFQKHGLATDLLLRLNLMLEELATNSINYSLSGLAEPQLQLQLAVEEGFVVARLEDNGAAYNPFTQAPEPDTTSELAKRRIGGLGVHLTKKLSDRYAYQRIDQRNRIILHCRIEEETDGEQA